MEGQSEYIVSKSIGKYCIAMDCISALPFTFSLVCKHTTDELRASLSCRAEAVQEYFISKKPPIYATTLARSG